MATTSDFFAWDLAILAAVLGAFLWAARRAWRMARHREAMDTQMRADARGTHTP